MIPFFELIKQNALLYAFLINGNLSSVDSVGQNFIRFTNQAVSIKDFYLNDLHIEVAELVDLPSCRVLRMNSKDDRLFNNTQNYFNRTAIVRLRQPFLVDGKTVVEEYKDLGIFESPWGTITISSTKSNLFNYSIELNIYPIDVAKSTISNYSYFIKGIKVPQEVMYLFDPDDVLIELHHSPTEYKPIIEIKFRNSDHPFLKYLLTKAALSFNGRLFEHGYIPRVRMGSISKMSLITQTSEDDSTETHTLLIESTPPLSKTGRRITYQTQSPEPKYILIDNRLLDCEQPEAEQINLDRDFVLENTIWGKEAVEKFGHVKYSQGVDIYKRKSTSKK